MHTIDACVKKRDFYTMHPAFWSNYKWHRLARIIINKKVVAIIKGQLDSLNDHFALSIYIHIHTKLKRPILELE